jgi:DNA-binding response OmpR family regulator
MNRVLLVEDDAVCGGIYRNKLQLEGFTVEWVLDGGVAITAIPSFKPDLVLLDLALPKVSGVEVLKFIRAQPETKALPVFVLTNAYNYKMVQDAWKAGATKCLTKMDTNPRKVAALVRHALDQLQPATTILPPAPVPAPATSPAPSPTPAPVHAHAAAPAPAFAQSNANAAAEQILQAMRSLLEVSASTDHPDQSKATAPADPSAISLLRAVRGSHTAPSAKSAATAPILTPSQAAPPPAVAPAPSAVAKAIPDTMPPAPVAAVGTEDGGRRAEAFTPPAAYAPPTLPPALTTSRNYVRSILDLAFEDELRRTFLENASHWVTYVQRLWRDYNKVKGEGQQQALLFELYRKAHWFAGSAAITEIHSLARLAAPFEAFLADLCDKSNSVNVSTNQTVAQTLDCLRELISQMAISAESRLSPFNILVVDDEAISRQAIAQALQKANLKSINVEDPMVAYSLATSNVFDLVITDIEMPGMTGFELCEKLRALPQYNKTPVIFVTYLKDLSSRSRAVLSGAIIPKFSWIANKRSITC